MDKTLLKYRFLGKKYRLEQFEAVQGFFNRFKINLNKTQYRTLVYADVMVTTNTDGDIISVTDFKVHPGSNKISFRVYKVELVRGKLQNGGTLSLYVSYDGFEGKVDETAEEDES